MSSPSVGSASTSTRSRSGSGWPTSRRSASTSAAPPPTSPSPPPGTAGSSAVVTRTGDDPFGRCDPRGTARLRRRRPVGRDRARAAHPGDVLRDLPAGRLPALLLRPLPTAADLQIRPDELDLDAVAGRGVFWVTGTGLCQEPSRGAHLAALEAPRPHARTPSLDLDYRPMFWASRAEAARADRRGCCRTSPSRSATSTSARPPSVRATPSAPRPPCSTAGSSSRSSSRARAGVLARTARRARRGPAVPRRRGQRPRRGRRVRRRAVPRAARRLAAGARWSASPTSPARSSPPGWSAPRPCRPRPRCESQLEVADRAS